MAEPQSPESPQEYETICNVPLPNDAAPSLLKVPKEEDNDAMRLWRATVHPLDNIGEPSSAEWGRNVIPADNALPLDYPLSEYNNPPRWIFLKYPTSPGAFDISAQWIPGKKYEYGWSKINSGANADQIPNYRVTHGPIPQYVPRAPRDPIPISELGDEWLEHLVRETSFKEKTYIRNFVNSHIKPIHPFDDDFTRKKADRIRQAVANILIGASMSPGDAEIEVSDKWSQFVPDDPMENESGSDKMALDIDSLEEDMHYHNKMDLDEREEVQGPAEPAEPFRPPPPSAPIPSSSSKKKSAKMCSHDPTKLDGDGKGCATCQGKVITAATADLPGNDYWACSMCRDKGVCDFKCKQNPRTKVWQCTQGKPGPAPPSQDQNPDNSYDGGSKRRHRIKSTNKRSKRRGKSTKKRSKKRVGKSRKRQRRHK
jgi:hypothetical protein